MQLAISSNLGRHCPSLVARPRQMAAGTLQGVGDFVHPQAATTRKVAAWYLHYWYQAAECGLGMCFLILGPKAQTPTPAPRSILSGDGVPKNAARHGTPQHSAAQRSIVQHSTTWHSIARQSTMAPVS